jgi:endo-1,4-beta-xylanase
MKKIITAISMIGLLAFIFAGCKINPAVLQSSDKVVDSSKPSTKKATGFEQISESENILPNGGFEEGIDGWVPFGTSQIDVTSDHVHSGDNALLVTGRLESWQGAGMNISAIAESGKAYRASAWVSLDPKQNSTIKMTVKRVDEAGTKYTQIGSSKVQGAEWVELAGEFDVEIKGELKELTLYFEGPGAGIDFYVDDVAMALKK